MTEATPRTRFIPCAPDPERPDPSSRREYCGGLVIDTDDMRRQHREWHAHEVKVKEAFRSALTARDVQIAELSRRIDDMQRDVANIDIPDPIDPIEITVGGWSDDDEPEADDPDTDTDTDEETLDEIDLPQPYTVNPSALYTPATGPLT